MTKNQMLNKIRKILANKKIASRAASTDDTFTTLVTLDFYNKFLKHELEETLKKEWKLEDIDGDLDFDLEKVKINWIFYIRKNERQGYGELVIACPDQKIKISGKALYTVEESKVKRLLEDDLPSYKDLEYDFEFDMNVSDVKIEGLRDFKLESGTIIQPERLELYSNTWTLYLER